MHPISKLFFYILLISKCYSQNNHVFSGGEMMNYGKIDISFIAKINWSSERNSLPGYYSVINYGLFIGYSDEANINGYIKKYGNTPFLFPVGNGKDLRTLEISAPAKSTDAYAVAWVEGDPSQQDDHTNPHAGRHPVTAIAGPIKEVSKVGQWDWQVGETGNLGDDATGDGRGLTITVSIPDMRSFAEASALRLVGWNGSNWIDLSKSATANGNTEDSQLSGTMISGISALAIGRVDVNNNDASAGFLLYPNPVINYGNIHARFSSSYSGSADIIIYDAIGKRVIKNIIQIKSGLNLVPLDIKILSNGNYYVNIIAANGTRIVTGKKFIKQ